MDTIQKKDLQVLFSAFAASQQKHAAKEFLHSTGYAINSIDTEYFGVHPNIDNKILVLFVDDLWVDWEVVYNFLSKKPANLPCLCILRSENFLRNMDVILRCCEFVLWPCDQNEFIYRLQRLIHEKSNGNKDKASNIYGGNLIGTSSAFSHVLKQIRIFAGCDAPVIVRGEAGTGKEMVARAIHYHSSRRSHPFIAIDCGSISDRMVENGLIGDDKKTVYINAELNSQGLIKLAYGGTLFLNGLESLSRKGQESLLRFLETQDGGLKSHKQGVLDIRIIVASCVDIDKLVEQKLFNKDLIHRLSLLTLTLPALRHRKDDILLLAQYCLDKLRARYKRYQKYFHMDTVKWMRGYKWRGNVTELETLTHKAFMNSQGDAIKVEDFFHNEIKQEIYEIEIDDLQDEMFWDNTFNEAKSHIIQTFEKRYLCNLMQKYSGNVTLAAKKACKERRALGKLLKKHGINRINYT